ncbi:linear amide C-N hydrolase [Thiotrichales bacterium 19S3-7]|nr:linear amide C-N hydrolase [Thiotrichales bacterium 19S3-7]MCF6802411.1 linear amide C-N hydrolase [Thiotrichales bacterium 19S3-11]
MKKLIKVLFIGMLFYPVAFSCTNVPIIAKDGTVVVARTLEFGPNLKSRIISSPEGKLFKTQRSNNKPTMSWQAKYGYVLVDYFGTGYSVDGLNTKGLSFGYLYLPESAVKYMDVPKGKENSAVPYTQFGDWILGNFSSIKEVKSALKNVYVYAQALDLGSHKNVLFPLHAVITDRTGESLVVEFIDGKLEVHDSKPGILTNAPRYDWQITNLRNYVNLSPYFVKPFKSDNIVYESTGQGSGMVGLPGDASPVSRFVKMSMMQQTALPVADAQQALVLAQHIINNVDLPYGYVRGAKGEPLTYDNIDKTQWVVFKDLKNNKLYFRSYENPTIQLVDLNKLNLSKGAKSVSISISQPTQIIPDATNKLS